MSLLMSEMAQAQPITADLQNSKFGCNEIGVLILEYWMRVEMGSGLSVSDSELSGLVGSFSLVCSSLE
jgi:hypothetical protein